MKNKENHFLVTDSPSDNFSTMMNYARQKMDLTFCSISMSASSASRMGVMSWKMFRLRSSQWRSPVVGLIMETVQISCSG